MAPKDKPVARSARLHLVIGLWYLVMAAALRVIGAVTHYHMPSPLYLGATAVAAVVGAVATSRAYAHMPAFTFLPVSELILIACAVATTGVACALMVFGHDGEWRYALGAALAMVLVGLGSTLIEFVREGP